MKLTPNQRLRELRLELNMSQNAFGTLLELKQGSYTDVERGKVSVSSAVLNKLENLGFSSRWITHGEGSFQKSKYSSITERLMAVVESLGYKGNLNSLAERLGLSLKDLTFFKTVSDPSEEFLKKFFSTFTQVNRGWVLENKGSMFNVDTQQAELMRQELTMIKQLLKEKDQVIEEKTKLISNLYKQIDLLQSFVPERGQ